MVEKLQLFDKRADYIRSRNRNGTLRTVSSAVTAFVSENEKKGGVTALDVVLRRASRLLPGDERWVGEETVSPFRGHFWPPACGNGGH